MRTPRRFLPDAGSWRNNVRPVGPPDDTLLEPYLNFASMPTFQFKNYPISPCSRIYIFTIEVEYLQPSRLGFGNFLFALRFAESRAFTPCANCPPAAIPEMPVASPNFPAEMQPPRLSSSVNIGAGPFFNGSFILKRGTRKWGEKEGRIAQEGGESQKRSMVKKPIFSFPITPFPKPVLIFFAVIPKWKAYRDPDAIPVIAIGGMECFRTHTPIRYITAIFLTGLPYLEFCILHGQ